MTENYNLKNIRELLTEGFTSEDLRNFCFEVPTFQPVHNQLSQSSGKTEIISRLLEYARRKMEFKTLLEWAEAENPARFEQHKPYQSGSISGQVSPVEQPEDQSSMLDQYLQSIIESYSAMLHWHIVGSPEEFFFDDIFVEPQLSAPAPLRPTLFDSSLSVDRLGKRPSISCEELISMDGKRLLLVGDIGTGKTILSKYICHLLATKLIQDQWAHNSVVPVFVSLFQLEVYLQKRKDILISSKESPIIHLDPLEFASLLGTDVSMGFSEPKA